MQPITTIKIPQDSPWFQNLTRPGRPFSFRFTRAERQVMKKRRKIRTSLWSERHRFVSAGKFIGPWRNATTPHLVGIMDAMGAPCVRTVIICAPPQTGKSECVNNFIGRNIDVDPGPVLYIYPEQNTAIENSKDRILPMIETSRRLSEYLTGWDSDKANLRIKLVHMFIYLAWAGSAARLANKPIKYAVFDETDKYPELANAREADPVSLGEKRVITYRYDHKIIKLSTPTVEQGPIWKALTNEAEEIFKYHLPCPSCGTLQILEFPRIKWPKEKDENGKENHPDPETLETEQLARYECVECAHPWTDIERDMAAQKGEWIGEKSGIPLDQYITLKKPRKIGFQYNAWSVPRNTSFSAAAAAFLKGKSDKTRLKDFRNNFCALPWLTYTRERQEDKILLLRDDRPRGLVPSEGVYGITAAVDTQDSGFWYEIRAWGKGFESWQIREGFVPSMHKADFSALDAVLFEDTYRDINEKPYPVQLVVIDSGGHRTWEVYQWCRKKGAGVYPVKGEGGRMSGTHAWTKQDTIPGTTKPIPGGIMLLRLNSNFYKDQLSGRLEISPRDPGAWHFHSETPMSWATQMCAEFTNDKGLWECPNGKANHAWDVSYYNWAAADLFVKYWPPPGSQKRKPGRRHGRVISRGVKV